MPLAATDLDLPGVTPSRQKRSRETTAALLRAGAEMLRRESLDDISIAALCAAVGATVGAFYSRFESKEAYFAALLELAARDADAGFARLARERGARGGALSDHCAAIVAEIAGWMHRHEGVVRAALQHNDTRPARWNRFKELARRVAAASTPRLLAAMGKGGRAAKTRAIGFGFQVVFGTLVNAVLNDPGPLSIGDAELTARLSDCLWRQLAAAAPARTVSRAAKRS